MNRKQRRALGKLEPNRQKALCLRAGQHPGRRVVLHVGCGPHRSELLEREFPKPDWVEVRLDIDPGVKPEIVASITDLSVIESGAVDAVFSSHNVEHLFPHEVPAAFREFARVLGERGFALIGTPDLQRVATLIAEDKLTDVAYESPAGPISPIDMVFGHRASLAAGRIYMAHKTGFTARTLAQGLVENGFARAEVSRRDWDLWAIAQKTATAEAAPA